MLACIKALLEVHVGGDPCWQKWPSNSQEADHDTAVSAPCAARSNALHVACFATWLLANAAVAACPHCHSEC